MVLEVRVYAVPIDHRPRSAARNDKSIGSWHAGDGTAAVGMGLARQLTDWRIAKQVPKSSFCLQMEPTIPDHITPSDAAALAKNRNQGLLYWHGWYWLRPCTCAERHERGSSCLVTDNRILMKNNWDLSQSKPEACISEPKQLKSWIRFINKSIIWKRAALMQKLPKIQRFVRISIMDGFVLLLSALYLSIGC